MDASGNLDGVTQFCGDDNAGMAFVLSPSDSGWTQTAHYGFCNGCKGGYDPRGTLLKDSAGNFYGTTERGGKFGSGAIFRLKPLVDTFQLKALYTFGKVGRFPMSGLTMDADGNLYGTTYGGGSGGLVFELTGTTLNVLYSFCVSDGCASGSTPVAGIIRDSSGNLFGTTTLDGKYGYGTIFELTP